jgi:hypothetical protein
VSSLELHSGYHHVKVRCSASSFFSPRQQCPLIRYFFLYITAAPPHSESLIPKGIPSLTPARRLGMAWITPINLLLQDNAVHACLEERKDEARLSLELAEAVEDLCRWL